MVIRFDDKDLGPEQVRQVIDMHRLGKDGGLKDKNGRLLKTKE